MRSPLRVASPAVRAPVLAERHWTHLIVCATRIPRQIVPFVVPTVNAHHLVMLNTGGLQLSRRGLGPGLDGAELSAGEIHVTRASAPPYELGWSAPARELRAVHALIDASLVASIRAEHDAGSGGEAAPVAVLRDDLIGQLMRELDRSLDVTRSSDNLYADLVAELIALQLVRAQARRPGWAPHVAGSLAPSKLRRVCDYVQTHLAEEIRLADLSREAGLGRYHFVHAFKAATGKPPHSFVLECRIEEARRLLRESNTPIAEIALATGFNSQSHLTTRFRLATGETPSVCRRGR